MTQQDDITQRVLTDDEIQALWDEACKDSPQAPGWNRHIRFARLLLSQVRAPVADSTLPLEQALHELVDKIVPGLDTGDLVQDARRASTALSAILASAPVADERAAFARAITGRDDLEPHQVENVIDANLTRWTTWRAARDYYQQARAALASAPVAGEATYYAVMHGNALYGIFGTEAAAEACKAQGHPDAPFSVKPLYAAPQASAEPQQYTHAEVFGPMESAWNSALDQAAAVAKRISDKYAFGHYGNETDTADEIEREILALKQPQADKDGGQQKYWLCCGSKDPYHGNRRAPDCFNTTMAKWGTADEHSKDSRAALSATQAEQGERDE